jgi:large subunit ribosomal protein L54
MQRRLSSCAKGTLLPGINVKKDMQDPIALADTEYPAWLWQLKARNPPPLTNTIQYLRAQSKAKIKQNAKK